MTIEIPITIIGRDSVDVFLIEKSFQPFKNVKLFVFNESTVLFKFLLNSNYNKGYILIDTKVDLIYGEEILRKLTKLNLNFKNISISFLYNSSSSSFYFLILSTFSSTYFSIKTDPSPKAEVASLTARSICSSNWFGSCTNRMPLPPPPALALIRIG